MHKINIIKTLSIIENVLGIYRNYIFLDGSWRRLAQIRVFIESCLMVTAFVYDIGFSLAELDNVTYFFALCYVWFTAINALAALILSCINSDNFREFIFNINEFHEIYKDDDRNKRFINKQQRRFYLDVVLLAVALCFTTSTYKLYDSVFIVPSIMSVTMFLHELCQQYRFFYENFIFFEYIEVICVPLRFLNESVIAVVEKLNDEQDEMMNDGNLRGIQEELEKWAKASRLLVTATDNLGQCFGTQITLSLCTVTIYFITLLYRGISFMINPILLSTANIGSTLSDLCCFIFLQIFIINAGQRVQNEAEDLCRNLCALNNLLVGSSEAAAWARGAAGLARRLRAAPLRVRLLSSLAVQMALLADILALVANYTIVLLQFNHVV